MKFPPIRISWRICALALVNAVLLTAIGLHLWEGTQTDRILHIPAHQVKVPVLRRDLPALYSDFTGVRDRTPFYANRRFYVLPSKSNSPPPAVPNYVFGGAVIRPHGAAVALLNNPTNGSTLRVIAGKDLDRWHVEAVEASRVVLRYEDQRAEITRVAKKTSESEPTGGVSRARVTRGNPAQPGGGARVLGNGQTVSRAPQAAANLPPLAGSGSESIYIPPPPR
ncbi:MAG: hypothetical protein ACJ8R9_02705 [Steroidobacteraceae bacterium]